MRGISQELGNILSQLWSLIGSEHILLTWVATPVLLVMSELLILLFVVTNYFLLIIIVTILVIVIFVVIVIVEVSIFIRNLLRARIGSWGTSRLRCRPCSTRGCRARLWGLSWLSTVS